VPRQIPQQSLLYSTPVLMAAGGVLPFGAVFVELYFIMSSLWQDQFYYVFGFLLLVFLLLVVTCAEIAVVLVYFQLCAEDYRWWWRSVFVPGSSGLYLFGYSLYYLVKNLHMADQTSILLYLGYMSIISLLFFILTGAIGFFATFRFVVKIYGSIKVD
jgi:transmembrane 9 superfamily protein 2/4